MAEGEVTFKSLLFVPATQPAESFNKYGSKSDNIKVSTLFIIIFDLYSKELANKRNAILFSVVRPKSIYY